MWMFYSISTKHISWPFTNTADCPSWIGTNLWQRKHKGRLRNHISTICCSLGLHRCHVNETRAQWWLHNTDTSGDRSTYNRMGYTCYTTKPSLASQWPECATHRSCMYCTANNSWIIHSTTCASGILLFFFLYSSTLSSRSPPCSATTA